LFGIVVAGAIFPGKPSVCAGSTPEKYQCIPYASSLFTDVSYRKGWAEPFRKIVI
jgi:hypothetical protein